MTALRQSARGEACTIRLPGCKYGGETVVLAHIRRPWNAGVGMKPKDWHGAFACANCHDLIDGRKRDPRVPPEMILMATLDGHLRTLDSWKERGLI